MEDPYKSPKSQVGRNSVMLRDLKPTSKSIFKLLFIGFLFGFGPIFLFGGFYALFTGGESMVSFNDEKLTGLSGFIGTLIFIPIFSLIFSAIVWLFVSFGIWLYTRAWNLNLEFKE
ncbi:MAG: hypothetical protein H6974_12375 [Gammaproteobacteria bacterium]|nr:hypothetical protein [Gammaproteobacteria bacterium]